MTRKRNKTLRRIANARAAFVIAAAWMASQALSSAQVTNVGYLNLLVSAGDNLVAAPMETYPDNSIQTILKGLPSGSTLTAWDPVAQAFLPPSVYDPIAGWSINYTLAQGIGGVLHCASNSTVSIWGSFTETWTPPPRSRGVSLISCGIPIAGASFQDIVGRDPQAGEWVRTLDASNQTYTTTTFMGTSGWDHGMPALQAGQAAFFYLSTPLSIRSGPPGNLILSWPTNMGPWQLQEKGMDRFGSWADVTAVPGEVGDLEQVILPVPVGARCFRLRTP